MNFHWIFSFGDVFSQTGSLTGYIRRPYFICRQSTSRNNMAGPSCILAIPILAVVVSATLPTDLPSSCAAVLCGPGSVCKVLTGGARCVPTNKPGSCPKPISGLFGICIARCSTDADCDDDLKCCGGCPRDCTRPVTDKPGFCPRFPRPDGYRNCNQGNQCRNDFDCGGKLKCCGSCRRRCVTPFPYSYKG